MINNILYDALSIRQKNGAVKTVFHRYRFFFDLQRSTILAMLAKWNTRSDRLAGGLTTRDLLINRCQQKCTAQPIMNSLTNDFTCVVNA